MGWENFCPSWFRGRFVAARSQNGNQNRKWDDPYFRRLISRPFCRCAFLFSARSHPFHRAFFITSFKAIFLSNAFSIFVDFWLPVKIRLWRTNIRRENKISSSELVTVNYTKLGIFSPSTLVFSENIKDRTIIPALVGVIFPALSHKSKKREKNFFEGPQNLKSPLCRLTSSKLIT